MGKHFGNLKKYYGATYYSLSPTELRPFAGIFVPGLQNWVRRYSRRVIPMTIPFLIFYSVCYSVHDEYKKSIRKNPDEFKNDV